MDEFTRKALDLALAWPRHDQKTLGDLVERLTGMIEEDQAKVWDVIDTWASSETDEKAKAELRERIRRFAFTRHGRLRGLNKTTKDRAYLASERLQPHDAIIRHSWLFAQHWIEPSIDEIEDENFDYDKHNDRTQKLRTIAMKEIWAERGFDGVTELLSHDSAPSTVGQFLAFSITDENGRADFLRQCLSITGDLERKFDFCIHGFLDSLEDKARAEMLSAVAESMATDRIVRLFRHAPFRANHVARARPIQRGNLCLLLAGSDAVLEPP